MEIIFSWVLIDTWWNVNAHYQGKNECIDVVLIDTWWNVNARKRIGFLYIEGGFNRYMVECESSQLIIHKIDN